MSQTRNHGCRTLQLGFMPLIDCAPLVAAVRLGLDRKHGLQLQLHRQASWAAVRDRLLSGELDAVQALAGLVYGVETGIGGPRSELAILLTLNHNGQAIALSPSLAQPLQQGRPLAELLATLPRRPVFAQTFPTGTHAMWLYYWLAAQGVDPMTAIDSVTLSPSQMPDALARGELDGFCAGEPWVTQAQALAAGRRVMRSGRIWPGHPEKVLACRREFAALEPDTAIALTAAVLEACRWLDERANRREAVAWLADAEVIGLPAERIAQCLLPDAAADDAGPVQALQFHNGGAVNFPWLSDGRWFLQQFRRWGWLAAAERAADDALLANVHRLDSYRAAAARIGVPVPAQDSRRSILFDGSAWE
ncbi:CmpA/NrtA family ABC transporter substrate-binding protein [Lysobacter cavernae]|uniref:CmpA/NrtA family ABC transporter substrate-binding protein n=1 Tax=Lysobacter cavernae TaxID=1685901 RepID=A0ABV7RP31_9GAMM